MIHPRMATMLSFVLTDATASPATLRELLRRDRRPRTWDQLSVDGDTTTNDTVFLLASGAAGAASATTSPAARSALAAALEAVARDLARQQAARRRGRHGLITCQVSGATDDVDARASPGRSSRATLVKAAVHGRDPNWGRIAGAAGNARSSRRRAVLEAAGLSPDEAAARAGRPARRRPGHGAHRDRRAPRLRRACRWPAASTRPPSARRWPPRGPGPRGHRASATGPVRRSAAT